MYFATGEEAIKLVRVTGEQTTVSNQTVLAGNIELNSTRICGLLTKPIMNLWKCFLKYALRRNSRGL